MFYTVSILPLYDSCQIFPEHSFPLFLLYPSMYFSLKIKKPYRFHKFSRWCFIEITKESERCLFSSFPLSEDLSLLPVFIKLYGLLPETPLKHVIYEWHGYFRENEESEQHSSRPQCLMLSTTMFSFHCAFHKLCGSVGVPFWIPWFAINFPVLFHLVLHCIYLLCSSP